MSKLIFVILILCNFQTTDIRKISKNGMTVEWKYNNDRLEIMIKSPKQGWVAIGFNESSSLKGTYLIMGNVIDENVNVVEYYTLEPGLYKPIAELGGNAEAIIVSGIESNNKTTIKFSLPIASDSKFKKHLTKGATYNLLMAYSLEDDFQHHSVMRTSVKIKL